MYQTVLFRLVRTVIPLAITVLSVLLCVLSVVAKNVTEEKLT